MMSPSIACVLVPIRKVLNDCVNGVWLHYPSLAALKALNPEVGSKRVLRRKDCIAHLTLDTNVVWMFHTNIRASVVDLHGSILDTIHSYNRKRVAPLILKCLNIVVPEEHLRRGRRRRRSESKKEVPVPAVADADPDYIHSAVAPPSAALRRSQRRVARIDYKDLSSSAGDNVPAGFLDVEDVLAEGRDTAGQLYLLCKWKGFDVLMSSWSHSSEISDALKVVLAIAHLVSLCICPCRVYLLSLCSDVSRICAV